MDAREWFSTATSGVRTLLPGLANYWDQPGLGNWSVRSLLGHTSRAFSTLETYLVAGADSTSPIALDSAAAYYRAAAGSLADPVQVTERGRQAGIALGDDPAGTVDRAAQRALDLIAATSDDAVVATPLGAMTLTGYLPTRAFELSVHGIDLARASGQAIPVELTATAGNCLQLACGIASEQQRLALLLASTGRAPLPQDFSTL
ncbi:mycothiol maleylpyruvate isomerase-like protein [Brevibacterium pityocampae]